LQRGGETTTGRSGSVSFQECLQSVALVRSRAFQLSKSLGGQPHCAMVPVLDLFNHPSQSAISYYGDDQFLQTPISQATIAWDVVRRNHGDGDSPNTSSSLPPSGSSSAPADRSAEFVIQVHSPKGRAVPQGAEVWNWYGDGGYVSDPERRRKGIRWDPDAHEAFVEIYGFDPWATASS
jgi:hypothetical protein